MKFTFLGIKAATRQ